MTDQTEERALRDALERAQSQLKAANQRYEDLRQFSDRQKNAATEPLSAQLRDVTERFETFKRETEAKARALAAAWQTEVERRDEALRRLQTALTDTAPAPPKSRRCTKCDAAVMEHVVVACTATNGSVTPVVEVYEDPSALFFKGAERSELRATVCTHCGFTELFAQAPGRLFTTYRRGRDAEAG